MRNIFNAIIHYIDIHPIRTLGIFFVVIPLLCFSFFLLIHFLLKNKKRSKIASPVNHSTNIKKLADTHAAVTGSHAHSSGLIRKKHIVPRMLILFLLVFCFLTPLSIPLYVKYKARHKIFVNVKNIKNAEFAIVLGAGLKKNNQPGRYLKNRLDDAITLYKKNKVKKILVSGDNGKKAHDEISVMNNYLVKNGIPQDIIFGDYAGFNTYSTMERAYKIFGIKKAIIVSQGYHLPRAVYIARQKGIDATGYATKQSYGKRKYFSREYFATIKSFFDCFLNRKSKYYGKKVDTDKGTNINLEQLNKN